MRNFPFSPLLKNKINEVYDTDFLHVVHLYLSMSIPLSLYHAYIDLNACIIWAEMSASLEI